MGKKSEERERKKALAQQKFEESKLAFIAKVASDHLPKQVVQPPVDNEPRLAPHLARAIAAASNTPKVMQGGSRFGSQVTWCISKADRQEHWTWCEPRDWTNDEWDNIIHPPLIQFQQLTWQEIDQFSSESGHKMHHGHELSDLIPEAQLRWCQIGLEEFDSVFRFRLGGQRRAWGFIAQAHFHFVWWDREHSIYPTEQN